MKHLLFPALLVPALFLAAPAQAADDAQAPRGWLHHHDGPHGPGFDSERAVKTDGTAVYGWTYREDQADDLRSCGAYHYWDGSACVDARHTPPSSQ
jgi:hypothetical protein